MKSVSLSSRLLLLVLASVGLFVAAVVASNRKHDDLKPLQVNARESLIADVANPEESAPFEFDFGVTDEVACRHEFRYKNKESATLHVQDLSVTCACLKVLQSSREIEPGDIGTFLVELGIENVVGQSSQALNVAFREMQRPVPMRITAFAPGFQLRPNRLQFGRVAPGTVVAKDVSVVAGGIAEPQILDVSTTDSRLTATLLDAPNDTTSLKKAVGQLARLEVKVHNSDSSRLGEFDGDVTLRLNGQKQHYISLKVHAHFTASYSVSPETVFLGTLGPGDVAERKATLSEATGVSTKLSEPIVLTAEHDEISAELQPETDGSRIGGRGIVIRCVRNQNSKTGSMQGMVIGKAADQVMFRIPYVAYLSERE